MHRSERPGLTLVCSVCGLVRAAIRKRSRNQHYKCPSALGLRENVTIARFRDGDAASSVYVMTVIALS